MGNNCTVHWNCTNIIVAGGVEYHRALSTVEVMNTENHQWSTAADLPQSICVASATVCEDRIYILGGLVEHWIPTMSVYTCSVSALIKSCTCAPSSMKAKLTRTVQASVWRQIADLPLALSTCKSFHGRLLAVGGRDDSWKGTTAVYMYDLTSNSWEIVSQMTIGRHDCFTAVLPNNQLMVVGGQTDGQTSTDTVELASTIMHE